MLTFALDASGIFNGIWTGWLQPIVFNLLLPALLVAAVVGFVVSAYKCFSQYQHGEQIQLLNLIMSLIAVAFLFVIWSAGNFSFFGITFGG